MEVKKWQHFCFVARHCLEDRAVYFKIFQFSGGGGGGGDDGEDGWGWSSDKIICKLSSLFRTLRFGVSNV